VVSAFLQITAMQYSSTCWHETGSVHTGNVLMMG